MIDEPLHFSGGLTKRSYFNQNGKVLINDKEAHAFFKRIYV